MENKKALALIEDIKKNVEKNGFDPEKVVDQLKDLREMAKEEQDPLLVKAIRLTYEYIEEKGTFNVSFLEETEGQYGNFFYFLDLVRQSDNKYNREELQELSSVLKEQNT